LRGAGRCASWAGWLPPVRLRRTVAIEDSWAGVVRLRR
jgi:hypothetical protein